MKPEKFIENLMKETKELGLEYPTENMLIEMVRDVQYDTLCNPEETAKEHGLIFAYGMIQLFDDEDDNGFADE